MEANLKIWSSKKLRGVIVNVHTSSPQQDNHLRSKHCVQILFWYILYFKTNETFYISQEA